jgi:hypothetical protein
MMFLQPLHAPLLICATSLALAAAAKGEEIAPYFLGDRILINSEINQQPVRFALDTGASFSTLFGPAADSPARSIGWSGIVETGFTGWTG